MRVKHRASRFLAAAAVAVSVAACGLPRSGPSPDELTQTETDAGPLPFSVVSVTAEIAEITRIDERRGFTENFLGRRPVETSRIARDDVLSITVWEGTDQALLTPSERAAQPLPPVVVDEKGMIFVPYVGEVRAAGRTMAELRNVLRVALAEKTVNPQVDVRPVESTARSVSVQGVVNRPGLYPIESATRRLMPMLAQAGGIREDPEVILLRLRRGEDTGEIWVQDLYDRPDLNVSLRPGDSIVAERDRRVYTVLGAVSRQSTLPFPQRELTVVEALGQVGGLLDGQADPTGVFLFREERPDVAERVFNSNSVVDPSENGTQMAYIIDLTKPGGMFVARDFIMRDRDTMFVTNAPFVKWQKILQSFAPVVGLAGTVRSLSGQ